jgi:hypothetical protein
MGIGEGSGNGASLIIFVHLGDHASRILCIVYRVIFFTRHSRVHSDGLLRKTARLYLGHGV